MRPTKLDRRKKYTRMVLKDNLMKLLKEKQISSITVKELCERADINRSTFYSHYADQFDLLDKIEDEMIEDVAGYLSQYDLEKEEDSLQIIEKLIEYFATKQEVSKTLLSENMDTTFQKKVMALAHGVFMKNWATVNKLDQNVAEYVSSFIISGCIHVIKTWLTNDMDKPPREMAQLINKLINQGLK